MKLDLPSSVALFFAKSSAPDKQQIAQAFSSDAIVHDEGQVWRGQEDILAWLRAAHAKYDFVATPLAAHPSANGITVLARVTGNFPGGDVQLDYVFELEDGRISALEIH